MRKVVKYRGRTGKGVETLSLQEASLIEQSKAGDVESFEQLIDQHQKKIFNIAYRMLGNIEDASDVAQEALVKAYRGIKNFKGKSSFSTWLYAIVNNTCIDFIRKNRKTNLIYLDKDYETEEGSYRLQMESEEDTPEEVLEKKEIQRLVHESIEELSYDHKRAIILRDIEGFSYKEIAEILNCSEGTVKSRISRARTSLKTIIQEKLEV